MPGLFSSWKPRFRVRKTSDSERNPPLESHIREYFPPRSVNRRAVRFNDSGIGSSSDGPLNSNDWKFADDPRAPLAHDEVDEIKEIKSPPTVTVSSTNHTNGNLSSTIEKSDASSSGTFSRSNRSPVSLGVVYLELNDEVKRALLPPTINSIDTVRALFLRSFPQLTSQYLSLPHVKIYIQESSKGQLFYELDDLRDIKDQAVLRLREQVSGYQSPQPIRFTDHPPLDYLSESEIDLMDYRGRIPQHRFRPASAMDTRMLGTGTLKSARNARSPIPTRLDTYYDLYSSDTSSQDARSGSITPIIDKEARFRMETMERQLAGLSSLVHSALVSKGMSETSQRDMQELRRQILALHPDVVSEGSISSSAAPSLPDSIILSNEIQQQLLRVKRQISETQSQLKQIRRAAQMNTQNARDVLREAFERVQKYVAEHMGAGPINPKNDAIETLKSEHITHIGSLQKSLQTFEEDVEKVRRLVLNTNRKLRMQEVENFTYTLTKLGKSAAKLKTQFPTLQRELEKEIKTSMEKVVRDEKFIKEESTQIDQCLRRCKTLANMMVTMKKLAMVQDPSLNSPKMERNSVNREIFLAKENGFRMKYTKSGDTLANPGLITVKGKDINVANGRDGITMNGKSDNEPPPPVPPAPQNYDSGHSTKVKAVGDAQVLDTILDELTSTVQRDRESKSKSPASVRSESVIRQAPPKPPERYSTIDVRNRFTPSEMQEIQRRAADCISPINEFRKTAGGDELARTTREACKETTPTSIPV